MRSRFLNVDYFNPAPIQALETLDFLRLPLPHLPPSNIFYFEDLNCFDDLSVLITSLEIDRLPIENALSKFFSDVLPQNINVEIEDFATTHPCSREASFNEHRSFSSPKNVEVRTSEEEKEITFDGKDFNGLKVVQFEMPELDLILENSCFFQKEKLQIFSEVSDAEISMEMLDPAFKVQHLSEIQKSIYSVDEICQEYHLEQKADLLEDGGVLQGQIHSYHSTFPLLEVDEISLSLCSYKSMDDDELLFLEDIALQPWAPKVEVMGDGNELLGSIEFDILEYLSDHCLSKRCLEAELSCSNFFPEMDLITVIEHSHIEEDSEFHPGRQNDDSGWSKGPILFEEFQFFDMDLFQFVEVFFNSTTMRKAETCEQMWGEAMNFRNFNELVVIHELTLVDDSFKSLPVPILSDHEKIRSLLAFVEETLTELKPQPSSASDGIYLDWHLLEEDNFSCSKYSSCRKMLDDIDTYSTGYDLNSIDGWKPAFDFIFSDDSPDGPNIEKNKEMQNIPPDIMFMAHLCLDEVASSKLLNDEYHKRLNGEVSYDINSEKMSSLVESMSQFNDLEFFLNPRGSTTGKSHTPAVKVFDVNAMCPAVPPSDSVAAHASSVVQLQHWHIKLHQIRLSDDILALIDNFQTSYLAILKNETELTKTQYLHPAGDDYSLLRLPKEKLMDTIKKTSAQRISLTHGNDHILPFVTLCAIKQMACYLCYYGIRTTYLYIDKLCQSLQFLKFRQSFLQNLIEDAHGKAIKEIFKLHPSLSVIHEILQSSFSQSSLRILIVAEQVFWWTLKRLLTSMQISYNELQNFHSRTNQYDEPTDVSMDAVLCSDCCLVSYEYVSASFPFDKFSIILEYGGSCGSSRVSSISPKSVGFPPLHFLKVELEDSSVSKALCEGVDTPENIRFKMASLFLHA